MRWRLLWNMIDTKIFQSLKSLPLSAILRKRTLKNEGKTLCLNKRHLKQPLDRLVPYRNQIQHVKEVAPPLWKCSSVEHLLQQTSSAAFPPEGPRSSQPFHYKACQGELTQTVFQLDELSLKAANRSQIELSVTALFFECTSRITYSIRQENDSQHQEVHQHSGDFEFQVPKMFRHLFDLWLYHRLLWIMEAQPVHFNIINLIGYLSGDLGAENNWRWKIIAFSGDWLSADPDSYVCAGVSMNRLVPHGHPSSGMKLLSNWFLTLDDSCCQNDLKC